MGKEVDAADGAPRILPQSRSMHFHTRCCCPAPPAGLSCEWGVHLFLCPHPCATLACTPRGMGG